MKVEIREQISLLADAQESVIVAKSLSEGEHFTIRSFRMARDKYLDLHKVDPRDIRKTIDALVAALDEAREVVGAIAGENRPAREWAVQVRNKIDAALAQARSA